MPLAGAVGEFGGCHAAVLRLLTVERRIADPVLAAQLCGLHASLMLAQHANDLILGKTASPHRSSPSDELTYQRHVFRVAAQRVDGRPGSSRIDKRPISLIVKYMQMRHSCSLLAERFARLTRNQHESTAPQAPTCRSNPF